MSVLIEPGAAYPSLDMAKLQAGDPKEFQKLYRWYFDDFVKEASTLLKSDDEAPAIVSHFFIKCWTKCDALTSAEYFFAFLRTSINTYFYASNPSGSYSATQRRILEDIICNPAFQQQERQNLYAEIAAIPEEGKTQAREIFARLYVRQIPVTEIAREIELSEGAIQEALDLAYKILYIILSPKSL